jgi:hypothetical protein
MSARYFRDFATRCRKAARDCFDLYAKEEFRRLAGEFSAKADEVDSRSARLTARWIAAKPQQFMDRWCADRRLALARELELDYWISAEDKTPIPGNGGAKRCRARGRSQDRKRVAGGQDYEVRYEAKKTGASKKRVKKAIQKVGNSRRRVEKELD